MTQVSGALNFFILVDPYQSGKVTNAYVKDYKVINL